MAWEGLRATLEQVTKRSAESDSGVSSEFSLLSVRDTIALLAQRDELFAALESVLEHLPHTGGPGCPMCKLAGQIDRVLAQAGDPTGQTITCTAPVPPVIEVPAPVYGKCAACMKLRAVNAVGWCLECFSGGSR